MREQTRLLVRRVRRGLPCTRPQAAVAVKAEAGGEKEGFLCGS
jgi:hypothetical protein